METGLQLQYLTENMYIHQQTERHIHVDVLTVDSYMWLFLVTQPLAIAKIDMAVSTDCVMSKPKNIKKI